MRPTVFCGTSCSLYNGSVHTRKRLAGEVPVPHHRRLTHAALMREVGDFGFVRVLAYSSASGAGEEGTRDRL